MIHRLSLFLLSLLVRHTEATLFVSQALKSGIIPVPAPSLIMVASALLKPPLAGPVRTLGFLSQRIALPAAAGMTAGSILPFWFARRAGEDIFDWSKGLRRFKKRYLDKFGHRLEARPAPYILLLRAVPIVPMTLASLAMGVFQVSLVEFTIWTFIGTFVRSLALALAGLLTMDTFDILIRRVHRKSADWKPQYRYVFSRGEGPSVAPADVSTEDPGPEDDYALDA